MGVQKLGYLDLYATHPVNTVLLRSTRNAVSPTFISTVEFHLPGVGYPDRLDISGKHFLPVIALHLFMV